MWSYEAKLSRMDLGGDASRTHPARTSEEKAISKAACRLLHVGERATLRVAISSGRAAKLFGSRGNLSCRDVLALTLFRCNRGEPSALIDVSPL